MGYGVDNAFEIEVHLYGGGYNNAHSSQQQTNSLQGIGAHYGLQSAAAGVEPYQREHGQCGDHEWEQTVTSKWLYHELAQHHAHQI